MLKHTGIDDVIKDGEFVDCYLSCDAGEASYILKRAGFWCEDMQKLNNGDYTAFDVYRKLNKGPVHFGGLGNSYADCMNVPLEEDMRLRAAMKRHNLAFQSKVRFYFKNEGVLVCFLSDSLEHGHDVAYVNPLTNKAFSIIGGFPRI